MSGSGTGTKVSTTGIYSGGGVTLQAVLGRVRPKARDEQGVELTDNLALSFVNAILESIHRALVNVESNLIYSQDSVPLISGQATYSLSAYHEGLLHQGVWYASTNHLLAYVNGTDLVAQNLDPTATGSPARVYLAVDNKIVFHPIPDDDADGDVVELMYWTVSPQLSAVTDTLPWQGIWDRVIEQWLLFDFLERRESDTANVAIIFDQLWAKAMNAVYARGVRRWSGKNSMATVEGV